MDAKRKEELKSKIEKKFKESIKDEAILSMEEIENIEGGEECVIGCEADCWAGCQGGCWWSGSGSY
jgi:hypothetical protein